MINAALSTNLNIQEFPFHAVTVRPVARLEPLDLKGKAGTHAQRNLAQVLVEDKHADYCFTDKDNQPTLKDDIAFLFLNEDFSPEHETCEKTHGRLEIRKIWTSTGINDYVDFLHCGRVVCLHRHTEHLKSGKISSETVYLISSLSSEKASPAQLPDINRGYWGIENRNHYVRDVTFDEDRSQVRTKSEPRMMAALRHIAAKPHLCLTLLGI